ncbi:TetR/AcrR family transcriptional regulator [Anaerobium acetethylicum]|uniref:DNA-binding transcriptional regulator, AcrR family n=1 Tax=Anaerobium acetethylicum TaxID=1619234 RepID=A0A1D3TWB9_9FIRM|nr:TetR/AcrR family transcriptional regulator [Anaerobium acetethylicum]SCP98536.1 DNA-binding transcriptional regulator, AcrR family [Anaerobium acetethylicum]
MTGPSAGIRTTKSEQTKQRITDAYLDLILHKKWDKISVKEICSSVNITRGTFYQYYNDIYDLMEQIEASLLADITHRYTVLQKERHTPLPPELFEAKFDYAPPLALFAWFDFCKEHKKAIAVLLDPKHGDTYFVKKLKHILNEHIEHMMDDDGMPHDPLRSHFTKIYLELHFLAARTWLDSDKDDFLSIPEVINLLNTMRVGANYLTYKRLTSPDFDVKMKFLED